jgi:hypothetical protein
MFKSKLWFPVIIVLSTLLFFSPASNAFSFGNLLNFLHPQKPAKTNYSHHPVDKHAPQPTRVKVGVYVLHVGKYNLQDATYPMDFYLIFNCSPACKSLNYEIMNSTNASTSLVANGASGLIYRVRADLNKSDNLRDYPFDNHVLDIVVENRQATSDKMIFEADPESTALDPDLNVVGFKLLPTWNAEVTDHYYSVFQQTYSSYKFNMYITRPWLAGVLKGILPALIIVICNFLALFMKIEHTSQRLGIATSTLIAAAIFHLNLTASLPPLGYITYADMFMLINNLCLLVVLLEVVLTTYFIETKHHILAQRMNKIAAWLIPISWVFLQLITWSMFNLSQAVGGMCN